MSVRNSVEFAIVLLAVSGCGSGNRIQPYPVTGAVFVHGEPAFGARVFFSPAANPTDPRALRPFAVVDKDGSFRLTTYKTFDGAPAGDYVVTVTWSMKLPGASGNDDAARSPDRLKNAYGSPAVSKLRATVKPEPNSLEPFRLD
jgi:hypothetical protein